MNNIELELEILILINERSENRYAVNSQYPAKHDIRKRGLFETTQWLNKTFEQKRDTKALKEMYPSIPGHNAINI